MDNPYGAKLPPSLVTVENGFTFADQDSDLSSLNTTPRKQEQRKAILTQRIDPEEIEDADLSLQLSKANRNNPIRRASPTVDQGNNNSAGSNPPLEVVQVGGGGASPTTSHYQSNQQEENVSNYSARGRSRDEKLRDRKEKYRRMASPSASRHRAVRHSGRKQLNSWKRNADQRLEEQQKEKQQRPWFVPIANDDDMPEDELQAGNKQDDDDEDDDDDVSPMKATKHTFDDAAAIKEVPSEEVDEEPVFTTPAKAKTSPSFTGEKKQDDGTMVKRDFAATSDRRSVSPQVDMYGCPIFQVDDSPELLETKAKLDELDERAAEQEQQDSIKAMLSSASFFSKSAAQTLADPGAGITKLIGQAAQGVEALVLGPLEEVEEDAEETKSHSSEETPPPPPIRRARGRSPTTVRDSTNNAASRMLQLQQQQEESMVEKSFVLEDKSDVDIPATLDVTPHYVLDDLATMEKKKAATAAAMKAAEEKETGKVTSEAAASKAAEDTEIEAVAKDAQEKIVDVSSDAEIYVEDAKIAAVDEEVEAAIEIMDAIHVKDEVERLETLHAAEAARLAASTPTMSNEMNRQSESLKDTPSTPTKLNEMNRQQQESPGDTPVEKIAPMTEHSDETSARDDSTAGVPEDEVSEVVISEVEPSVDTPRDGASSAIASAEESSAPPEKCASAYSSDDEQTEEVEVASASASAETDSKGSGKRAAAVLVGVGGTAAVVTIAVTEDTEESEEIIERDPGQLVIAAAGTSEEEEEEEPEFPPTDDADVDRINFDTVSVESDGTPVRSNVDDSNEEPLTEPLKEIEEPAKAAKAKEAKPPPPPPETAPETPQGTPKGTPKGKDTKKTKSTSKKQTGSVKSKRSSPNVATRKDSSAESSKDTPSSKPAMVKTLDDNNGIAKGDMVLSLLNTNLNEANRAPKGSDQVRDAILRMRDMRRRQEKVELPEYEPEKSAEASQTNDGSPSKRSVLPVDVDDMHVVGASNHVKTLEEDAIEHLKHDEIEAALELYEEIVTIYAEAFKETAKRRKKKERNDHKAYIGAALHNIGILQLLRFDFEEALSFFEKAAENRKEHFGEGSVDHLASLNKIALCHYAMDEYETAHKRLEHVLELSKNHLAGLTDFMQVAEILNNLGCLSFMCGQASSAMTMFKECLEIQTAVLKQSLYSGPRFAGQSTSLNISVTRSNIGYVQMLTKNSGPAIVEFEASLMHQQMILSDAHDTVICTMDHLAVANLLAKNKEEAIKMLGRMLRAQLAAYGSLDERCILTLSKIQLVQTEQTDYLEKALEQLWNQHSTSASPKTKAAQVATSKRSSKMLKKLSFRKKVAKLS